MLRKEVVLASGEKKTVLAGTEKIDGYWATLRRAIGRRGINTGFEGSRERTWLEMLVRVHQWEHWNLDVDRFALFGNMLRMRRSQNGFF